jgi:hypothetical protein
MHPKIESACVAAVFARLSARSRAATEHILRDPLPHLRAASAELRGRITVEEPGGRLQYVSMSHEMLERNRRAKEILRSATC